MVISSEVQTSHSIPVFQIIRPTISDNRITVPVQDYSVFQNYKHFNVTPNSFEGQGYTSSRLRILDTIIDQIIQVRENRQSLETLVDSQSSNFGLQESQNAQFLDLLV